VLIIDASGSMTTADAPGPRIDAAKAAAKGLIDALPDDAVLGLVTYGTGTGSTDAELSRGCQDVTTLMPLGGLDRGATAGHIDALTPSGYTPISLALTRSADLLPADASEQAIVLVSDGEDTCGQPPCDVAAQLRERHPGLAISTVGFRTDGPASEQLSCIASRTGGLFVQAANANQLAARLLATQNRQTAAESLTSTGLAGVDLGSKAVDIRAAHPDFPDVAADGRVVVVWKDCDFTFTDGVLDEITPHGGGRTIDGITVGSTVSDAVKFYGDPVGPPTNESGQDWVIFTADKAAGAAYRMAVDGYSNAGGSLTGTVKRIILCRCMPHNDGPPVATFDGYGSVKMGMTEEEAIAAMGPAPKNDFSGCTVLGENSADAFQVWISGKTGRVTGIETPPGTLTDRGVGDGSTSAEIRAAYAGSTFTIDEGNVGGQGSLASNVFEGPVDYNASPMRLISFSLGDDGRAGRPSIGRPEGWEGC
jgi:Ca-activated chloride channel family protein